MARERLPSSEHYAQPTQPSQSRPATNGPTHQAEPSQAPVHPPTTAASKLATQPEFGKASPLRNPLRDPYANLFNTSHRRPEQHRPIPQPQFQKTSGPTNASQAKNFYLPGQRPQPPPQSRPPQHGNPLYGNSANSGAIRMPSNPKPRDIPPAPRPLFSSSIGPSNTYRPHNPAPAPRPKPIDLTNAEDDDDGFDPDAALRE
ncbi:hypothetical protein KCU98_g20944, partial [Aureobasidium melanogenum]